MYAEKISLVLVKRKMSKRELAEKLGISATNLYNQLKRDNFSEEMLLRIADILDCELESHFVLKDTGEKF